MGSVPLSVTAKIRVAIQAFPPGEPFLTRSVLAAGSRVAVDQALSRLVRAGTLERISRGVFVRPAGSRFVNKVPPSPARVVAAVARAAGTPVQVHGAEAARRLELTTQMPTQQVFVTSGPSRRLTVGKARVAIKHVSPRKLALAGRPAGEALGALWYLGKDRVDTATVEHVRRKLPPGEFRALLDARPVMPAWLARTLSAAVARG